MKPYFAILIRKLLISIVLIGAILFTSSKVANATDIRGLVAIRDSSSGKLINVNQTEVVLYDIVGGERRELGRTYTGSDGLYYFNNISPGDYLIIVGGRELSINISGEILNIEPIIINE